MANLSVILTRTFIDSFNYCDETGKRRNTCGFMKLFLNDHLTEDLEKLAAHTTAAMLVIHDDCLANNKERVADIIALVQRTIEKVWEIRIKYGTTASTSGGHNGKGEPSFGSDTTTPVSQSRFESELKASILDMRNNAKRSLLDKATGQIHNLDDYRDAIRDLKFETLILKNNSERCHIKSWAN